MYFCNTSWVDIWVYFGLLSLRLHGLWSIKAEWPADCLQTACVTERCFSGWLSWSHIVPVGETRNAYRVRWENLSGRDAMKSRRWWEDNTKRCCKWMDLESVHRISAISAVANLNSGFQDWAFLTIWASQQEQSSMLFGESFVTRI